MYLSIHPPEIVIFAKILAYLPLRTRIPHPIAFKDPRPAPPYNGGRWERPKPHRHTTSERGKKLWLPL